MVLHCIDEHTANLQVTKIRVRNHRNRFYLKIYVDAPMESNLNDELHELRKYITDRIQRFTGILLEEVSISIGSIKKKDKK